MLEAELQRILNLFEDFLEITLGARDLISGQFGVFIFIERQPEGPCAVPH
jgi:hypothetical protein